MRHIDVGSDVTQEQPRVTVDALMILCCIPVVLISGVVLVLAGGFNPGFFIPAVVVGAMIGMLMFISFRDRTTI